jgi:hypothetical protein
VPKGRLFFSLLLCLGPAALVGCGVDSYLTCGAPCDPDAGRDAADATVAEDAPSSADGSTQTPSDASSDGLVTESDAVSDGGSPEASSVDGGSNDSGCPVGSLCCKITGSCSSSAECCEGHFCDSTGNCVACLHADASCASGRQCCSESCVGNVCIGSGN